MKEGLIAPSAECSVCKKAMCLIKKDLSDGYIWQCQNKRRISALYKRSVRKNSWFVETFDITGKPSNDAEHPDYVPSIFAGVENKGCSSSMNRYNRHIKRRKVRNDPISSEIENQALISKLDTKDKSCQTDLTLLEISEMEQKLHALEMHLGEKFKSPQNEIFTNAKALDFYTKLRNFAFFTTFLNLVLCNWSLSQKHPSSTRNSCFWFL
ncbi:hypothetical protein TNCT_240621 [Trichonephila clavata]|uniref:Uncharacterized protein n=1 Tax=Trichonephila clavata TaxID=2740835 RepID=A0A8X6HTI0_TRICU|nr:hypothetical protein TNCT_240621 [Trichonephila clavata]